MNERIEFLDPEFEPGEFDRIERRLRSDLATEASRIHPSDRLETILAVANASGAGGPDPGRQPGARRWLVPLASAAAVAVIAGTVWAANQEPTMDPSPPAATSTAPTPTPTDQPTSGGTPTTPSPTDSPSTTAAPPASQTLTLPVYFVGPVGDDKPTYKLFREFLRGEVSGTSDAAKAKAALVLALNAQPFSNTDGYLQPWSGQTIGNVSVTSDLITIELANPGPEGFDHETERLAVQQLVWTAQAAVGRGTIPVRFEIADGSETLFGRFPTSETYNRPSRDESWRDLAPIWITSPTRDQVLSSTKVVVVKGEATAFEANVNWELKRGTAAVKSGYATAGVGAPGRGAYSIELGRLSPGDYTIRVFEMSMEGGDKVVAEKSVFFTVK
jgi:hypothetical protein